MAADGEPFPALGYRLTRAEWLDWVQTRTPAAAPLSRWSWFGYAASWITYVFGMVGWAAAAAILVRPLLGEGWSTAAFLSTFLGVTAFTSARDPPSPADAWEAWYARTLFARADVALRLRDEGVEALLGKVRMMLPWPAIVAVQETPSLVLVAYDETGGGVAIPRRAFVDGAQAERFVAELRRRVGEASGET